MAQAARAPFQPFDASRLPAPGAFERPLTVILFDTVAAPNSGEASEGTVLTFESLHDLAAGLELDDVQGLAGEIDRLKVDDTVYACIDPYAQDIRDRRELTVASDLAALRAKRQEEVDAI